MGLKFYKILALMSFLPLFVNSQTLPVGLLENVEDAYRRQQLLGKDPSNSSYMIRPLHLSSLEDVALDPDSDRYSSLKLRKLLYSYDKLGAEVYALPLVWQQQVNSHHPYGMNDGSMIQAKGYQTQISGGIFAKIGPLSVQLRPEYVYAENKDFRLLTPSSNDVFLYTPYSKYYSNIDLPQRFGNRPYSRMTLGQSSVRLTFDPVSVGFSNENLWWGPGIRSSLLMSNNASGFRHVTLNTSKPVKTPVGSFEAQIVGGRLESSGVDLLTHEEFPEIKTKTGGWRYLSGMVFAYQPKWVPGLYLGFDRTFVVYGKDMGSGFSAYFPIFSSVEKRSFDSSESPTGNKDDVAKRDQYISMFARWVMPESKAEVYFQWGRNDHSYDFRDFMVEPDHTRAYIVGVRKLISLPNPDEFIQVGVELTQLERPGPKDLRASESWYAHYQVKHGYTHKGQVLGAGIGPGSNLQNLNLSWVNGVKRIGLQVERIVNNNDLFYRYAARFPSPSQFITRHWIDLSMGGTLSWNYKDFILNAQLTCIKSLNYQYQWSQGGPNADFWNWGKKDVVNWHAKIGILYNWGF